MNNRLRVLITGAAGLIGSNLTQYLAETGAEVCAVDNLSGGSFIVKHPNVNFHNVDVTSNRLVWLFQKFQPDVVYHCAAYAAEGLSPFIRKFNYTNNLVATANVINCCIEYDVGRLVFFSSMAVYGNKYDPPFHEDMVPAPIDPYGIAKYACEMDIQVAAEQHGLEYCIIRPHNVYGPKQNIWDKYRNVLGIWMYKYMNGEPLTIFGDGQQKRAFSYIGDCLHPLVVAGFGDQAKNQIINLGGMVSRTIEEAADILIDVMGGGEKVFLEGRHETKYAYSTWEKSMDILSYGYETKFKDGLTEMWEYAQNAEPSTARTWDNFEVTKGLYNFWKNK